MKFSPEPTLGIVVPVDGQIHQQYLSQLYDGLEPIPREKIAFWLQPNGWMTQNADLVLLSSASLWWRIVNRCCREGRRFSKTFVDRDKCVPTPPIGWRKRFKACIRDYNIRALLIIYGGMGVAILPELQTQRIPVAVNFGGSDAQMGDHNRWYAKRIKELWQHADMCIFTSNYLKSQACQRGCPVGKSRVIYRGCALPRQLPVRRNGSDIRFVSVANLLPVKGHEYLLKAFMHVKTRMRNAQLSLVGSGPLKGKLQQLVKEFGLSDSVEFTGTLRWCRVQSILEGSDVYVQPSVRTQDGREEGLPNATVEAQALGLPAIVFRSGGLVEAVEDGQTGLVVPERDVKALAEAMVLLSEDLDLRHRMSKAAYHRAKERFDANKQNAIWRQTVEDLMSR